eukprot:2628260-Rhodomonas_salina.3
MMRTLHVIGRQLTSSKCGAASSRLLFALPFVASSPSSLALAPRTGPGLQMIRTFTGVPQAEMPDPTLERCR